MCPQDALADLQQAKQLTHEPSLRAEVYLETGMLLQKMRNFRRANVEFSEATSLAPSNAQVARVG